MSRARVPYLWGKSEELRCLPGISKFEMQGQDSPVCFAALITTDSAVLPWRKFVSDYVIKIDSDTYFPTTRESIKKLQSQNILPEQLHEYSLPVADVLFGHSLFLLIAFFAGLQGYSFFESRRQARKMSALSQGQSPSPESIDASHEDTNPNKTPH